MSRQCARCDWQPDAESEFSTKEQLAEHARSWEHPLCTVCERSLPDYEGMACDRCLQRVRSDLAGVALMYDELPHHLSLIGSGTYASAPRGSSDGRPLPGGDVLALLSGGSEGLAEDGMTTKDGDPASVAYELAWWEQDWRETRSDLASDARPRSARTQVHEAVRYLEVHARWAATSHPGFDEYAADLRTLHRRLEAATGRVRAPSRANAQCFDCGGDLVRRLITTTIEVWWLPDAVGPLPSPRAWVGPVEETQINDEGEDEPVWTCSGCARRYDKRRYNLALGEKIEEGSRLDVAGEAYATPRLAATLVARTEQTVRNWMAQGIVRREDRDDAVFVNLGDVRRESDARPRRARLRDSA